VGGISLLTPLLVVVVVIGRRYPQRNSGDQTTARGWYLSEMGAREAMWKNTHAIGVVVVVIRNQAPSYIEVSRIYLFAYLLTYLLTYSLRIYS